MHTSPPPTSDQPGGRKRPYIRWIITLIILGGLAVWGFFKGDELYAKLQEEWSQANLSFSQFGYGYFFIGLIVFFVSVLSTFFRWRILVRALDIRFSQFDAIRLGFVGYVSSQFAPGSVTGDIFKAGFLINEQPGRKMSAVASIIVDRFVGLYSLFLLASLVGLLNITYVWNNEDKGAAQLRVALLTIWAIAGVGLLLLCLFLLLPIKGTGIKHRLEKFRFGGKFLSTALSAFGQYRRHPVALGESIVLGMLGHIGFVLSYYFASQALPGPGETPDWQVHFLIIPFFMVIQAVPLTFGGNLGVGDVALGVLYEIVGATFTKGLLASLFQRVITWIVALIGLIWYIPLHHRMKSTMKAAEQVELNGNGE